MTQTITFALHGTMYAKPEERELLTQQKLSYNTSFSIKQTLRYEHEVM